MDLINEIFRLTKLATLPPLTETEVAQLEDLLSKAAVAQIKGQYHAALSASNKAIRLDAKNHVAYQIRGLAKHKLGDLEGAIEDLSQYRTLIGS